MEMKKNKILIIDDEPPMLTALNEAFENEGFSTLLAKDGEEGLQVALDKQPDIILLDILMPKIDGVSMMKKLRQTDWGKNIPVIFLTNINPDDSVLNAVVETQPAYYLIKSDMNLDGIIAKVKEVLN
jgi:CheY-like chemotaxis protein